MVMQSKAKTVSAYLDEVPADRRPALARLRQLCLQHLTGFEESMDYGEPCYSRNGVAEVGFASQKNNIALYILRKDVLDTHRDAFPKSNIGKGCIRYRNPDKIDFNLVKTMLIETRKSKGQVC
jgi:uncharacterized protein YdhG (YjbR/CyaY superfamily)